ncbi:M56 family metallopeptidase [Blautia sp. HCP3S3_G3]|uniref:M56 family metallopeptidase n=1 Tax=Blautia sp. HCP3S3_G3 TaxID=3438913 RepID=UPI003F8BA2D9
MLCICMTVAGSIPVVVCLVLWLIQRQSYNYYLGKNLLLIGMFFYLVPFQMVKYLLPQRIVSVLSVPIDINVEQNFNKVVAVKSLLSPGDSIWVPKWVSILLLVWLLCIIIFSVYQIIKYRIDIRKLMAQSEQRFLDVNGETVEVWLNKNIHTPYTVGFIKRSIIVPQESLNHPCFDMFYKHEEQHKRNFDSLMKLICIVIICIHWINPIAILLLFLYGMTAEYICDAKALDGYTYEEKKKYAKLLIELSTEDEPLSMVWRNNLSGAEQLIKRRITYMMKKNKMGLLRRGIAIAASVITVFASASTIMAYEPFDWVDDGNVDVTDYGEFGSFSDGDSTIDCDFSLSDTIFVYEDGTQVAITDDSSSYVLCNHTMTSGYYNVHKSNSSGGCTVTVFKAQKCTKCGYLIIGDLYKTETYPVCPH